MLGSVKVFLRNKYVKSNEIAIQKFIQSLQGMTDREVGTLVLLATTARHYAHEKLSINFLDPYTELTERSNIALIIGNMIKACQKVKQYNLASGFYVWLHTFRAFISPELKIYGKQLWRELQRGINQLNDDLETPTLINNSSANFHDYKEIPEGV